jgi:hypothetical protein
MLLKFVKNAAMSCNGVGRVNFHTQSHMHLEHHTTVIF